MRIIRHCLLFFVILGFQAMPALAQKSGISLRQCFRIASQHNLAVQQMKQSVKTRRYNKQAEQLNFLPDIDLLASYNYLSDPVRINLQSVRKSIVKGTARQNVATAKQIYHQITGNTLPKNIQNDIYQGSKSIIEDIYPDFNPKLSKQSYFTAGVALRMPVYLGGKLRAARQVAKAKLESGHLNLELTQNTVALVVASKYMQILYFNSMINKQKQLVKVYRETEKDAASMVKNEIIPPFQKHWASVALSQAKTNLTQFKLQKENALLSLQNLLGVNSVLTINQSLAPVNPPRSFTREKIWKENPGYRWLQSQAKVAKAAVDVTQSSLWPNIFLVANYQFNRKDLPAITPPWMVGVGMQWNLFSSFEDMKRIKASRSLVKESHILVKQKKRHITTNLKQIQTNLRGLKKQMKTLDEARHEAATTTKMVRRRLKNQLSSVKDVNEALSFQLEAEKAYFTAVLAYNIAAATYLEMKGSPKKIVDYMN